ncbi:MAG TPA: HAD family phosphatase [Thermodesulfobacteriaceae bacterium]|nr:HAD family phosphatase [Thermodesulfobacteriaceae bacterium]
MCEQTSILFDMDGVILDSMSWHVRAWQEALGDHGYSVPAETIYMHEGAIEPDTAVAIFSSQSTSIEEAEFQRILERQIEIFSVRYRDRVSPFPEAVDLVIRLHRAGKRMAIVTSSYWDILDGVLPKEIRNCMDHIVTGDQVARRKPHPDPYLAALSGLEERPDRCVVVENAPAGIAAAKAAALQCVALTTTLSEEHLAGADAVLDSHGELVSYLLG